MEQIQLQGRKLTVIKKTAIVVGTGAAGYNTADRLYDYGQRDIAIVTENIQAGTSRNTGSDKQTYYKLTLAGDQPDSVASLAQTLFQGGCVDGDIAQAEAALSAMSFLKLCDIGIPFPVNRSGEYVGYKTDHDPSRRATSVGPYTSKLMTQGLEGRVEAKGIQIFDKHQVISLLVDQDQVCGVLCLDTREQEPNFVVIYATSVVFATGGPASLYAHSVYPFGHYGATGLALEQGVRGKNLTEWQFGLASVRPRWNVSGTYMQVLPTFYSTDQEGNDPREFLDDFFQEPSDMLNKIFLKGYQWPFDCRKVEEGSSIVDLLVYIEIYLKGRRIFLDFRKNPQGRDIPFQDLDPEVLSYLEKAQSTFGTPLERLRHMNQPAVDFYLDKGVDLSKEPLEIALSAQHNNGGLAIDQWWQTNIQGFFAVGEVAASHGVYRPGGSALNAGQVGSTRAAQYISRHYTQAPGDTQNLLAKTQEQICQVLELVAQIQGDSSNVDQLWQESALEMSKVGGAIRNAQNIADLSQEVQKKLAVFSDTVQVTGVIDLGRAFRYKEMLISSFVYLSAMNDYVQKGGKSRGSALYTDETGVKPFDSLPDIFRFSLEDGSFMDRLQEVTYDPQGCQFSWRGVRPLPKEDDFFENVWRNYRENGNIY